jgi:hypothetical protein
MTVTLPQTDLAAQVAGPVTVAEVDAYTMPLAATVPVLLSTQSALAAVGAVPVMPLGHDNAKVGWLASAATIGVTFAVAAVPVFGVAVTVPEYVVAVVPALVATRVPHSAPEAQAPVGPVAVMLPLQL